MELVTECDIRELGLIVKTFRIDIGKKNETKNNIKYGKEDLATMDFAVAFIQETMNLLKHIAYPSR